MHRIIPLIIPILLTLSCFEEDKPVPPYPGKVTSIVDSVQTFLSYFDFETDNTVFSQRNDAWQLGFECGANGWHIITNSGANWFLLNTGQTNPVEETSFPVSLNHLYDVPHAYPDSTAAGDWVQFTGDIPVYTHEIYLLGHLLKGEYVNIIQVQFLEVNENAYTFYYKQQDGFSDTVTMQKDDRVNFVYFSFTDHAPVNIEPDKSTYDLVFAPYYDLATLFGSTIPYPVGGSYLNLFQTAAVLDSIQPYDEINATMIPSYIFSS
jgi:hypothetical protein